MRVLLAAAVAVSALVPAVGEVAGQAARGQPQRSSPVASRETAKLASAPPQIQPGARLMTGVTSHPSATSPTSNVVARSSSLMRNTAHRSQVDLVGSAAGSQRLPCGNAEARMLCQQCLETGNSP